MKTAIINYLKLHDHVKRRNLLNYLNNTGIKVSDRVLRATIDELIEKDGYLLISSSKGYKLALTTEEYKLGIDYLTSYAMSILKRRKAMKRNYLRATAQLIPS